MPTVVIENSAGEVIVTSGDIESMKPNETRSSPKLEFIETDYKVKLKASSGDGIAIEDISMELCSDNSCNTYDVKPEKGEQHNLSNPLRKQF